MNRATRLDRIRQIIVAGAVPAGVALGLTGDYGADGPLLVNSTGEEQGSLIMPAEYSFFVWGLIYLGGLAFAAHQARPSRGADPLLRRVAWFAGAAYLGQGLWARVAEQPWATWLVVAATLLTAGLAYARTRATAPLTPADRWLVREPLALHLGWLTLAAVLTLTESLQRMGAGDLGLGDRAWAVLLLLVAGAIATSATLTAPRSIGYPAAVVWGLAAVVARQVGGDAVVALVAGLVAVVVTAAAVRPVGPRPAAVTPGRA